MNTLGGALAITTQSARTDSGGGVELSGGSFGRKTLAHFHGGRSGNFDGFSTAQLSKDGGWAQHNPSRVDPFYGLGAPRGVWAGLRIEWD